MIIVNGIEIKPQKFPDGTKKIDVGEVPETIRWNSFNSYGITWLYDSDDELFLVYCISKTLKTIDPDIRQHLVMPYIPNARFDRTEQPNECFTLKYFAEIINSLNFERVIVRDPHSNVSKALFNNIVEEDISCNYIPEVIDKILEAEDYFDKLVAYFPDNGSLKRYANAFDYIDKDIPIVYGVKNRDWKTGEILGIEIHGQTDMLNENTVVLMIDDICSKGGTFYYGSKELEKYGCKTMYLYVTHCENTILEGNLLKEDSLFKKVFTTNSIFTAEHEKVEVLV